LKTTVGNHGYGRYYVVDENKSIKLPSVTTILTETSDKSGLIEWKNRVGEAEAERISTFSANRGTFMHALHEHYLNSRFVYNEVKPLQQAFIKAMAECNTMTKEEIECGKNLFLQFHNNSDFYERIESVMFQEIPLWSFIGGGYAGRMDLSIWGKPKSPRVIDFKTSRKPKKEEWIGGYKKQTAAYSVALHERHGIFPDSCEIWISCETGEVQLFEMGREEIKHWFNEFHKDLRTYHEKFPNN
jgi:genome maintenance exonuclease 1